ncbi:MAG: dihydropteroate synthase [Proteobacteria bacterium]|nr:dihydropteroate synthase [Pseudomonadota bacterium]NOG60878.1 dihydropteroate synthase [Pseudomonadota bacterium]
MQEKEQSQEHLLFLTGKLAQKRLQNILQEMAPTEFTYEIRNIGVSVAALMTAQMISRRLTELNGIDRIIVPGLCRGDLSSASQALGVECVRGTIDLKDLPAFFGRDCKPVDLTQHNVEIFGEIVDAPMVSIDEILQRAEKYRRDGADVIDIGCLPDTPFPHLEETINALHDSGFKVSIDSLEEEDLLRGGKAGADFLLSLKESSLWIADEVDSIPILIPENHGDMDSLYRSIEAFAKKGRPFYADAILDPIHFGFTESVTRYHELRQNCPDLKIMMGIGNLTELTEADTTGINALLFGMISEMDINAVLATEVSPHCRTAIKEADMARRIMFAAKKDESLPKGLDSSLLGMHARKPFPYNSNEIEEFYQNVKDPSYRIQVSEEGIHVYNRDGINISVNPFELFPRLELLQDDAPHAFYMGVELSKAQIAWQLGKPYMQDEELSWGVCVNTKSEEEKDQDSRSAHAMKELRKESVENREEYKAEGSTLRASRENKKKK